MMMKNVASKSNLALDTVQDFLCKLDMKPDFAIFEEVVDKFGRSEDDLI